MVWDLLGWCVLLQVLGQAWSTPVFYLEPEARPLGVVSDLGQRLVSHTRFQDASPISAGAEPRLPLPSPQDFEAIKKVAQILIMLGEQVMDSKIIPKCVIRPIVEVIPSIIGDNIPSASQLHPANYQTTPVKEEPNDPVNEN